MIKILETTFVAENKRTEYDRYLNIHISAVQQAYEEIFKELLLTESDLTVEDITKLEDNIKNHDNSKYYDEEYYPYLHWFYSSEAGADDEVAYDRAWNHHQKHNPHHWQYWILQKDSGKQVLLDIPENYVIEMLCDWSSFQYKNPESTANKWYNDNKDKMLLSENTRSLIEKYIKYCKEPLRR